MTKIGLDGAVFLLLALAGTAAVMIFLGKPRHRYTRRTLVWLFACCGALLVIGVTVWQDTLASLITTQLRLGILLILDVVSAFILYRHAGPRRDLHEKHFKHVRSPVLGLLAGTALTLTFLDGLTFLRQISHAPAGTASALGKSITRVQSGVAASDARAAGSTAEVLVVAGVVLLIVVIAMTRFHGNGKSRAKGRPAVGTGPGARPQIGG